MASIRLASSLPVAEEPTQKTTDVAIRATLSGGDLVSEVHRLRGAARFHRQEADELDTQIGRVLARVQRIDNSLGRGSAVFMGAGMPGIVAGRMLHEPVLGTFSVALLVAGAVGAAAWPLTKQVLRKHALRLRRECEVARERGAQCDRLALALDPNNDLAHVT